jgi:hypothetical protein
LQKIPKMKVKITCLILLILFGGKAFGQQNDFSAIPQKLDTPLNERPIIDTLSMTHIRNYDVWIKQQIDSTDHLKRLREDLEYTQSQISSAGKLYTAANIVSLLGVVGLTIGASEGENSMIVFGIGTGIAALILRWVGDFKLSKINYLNRPLYQPKPQIFRGEIEMIAPNLSKDDSRLLK